MNDSSNKLFRTVDSDSVQAPEAKRQQWQLFFLSTGFVAAVVVIFAFAAVSINDTLSQQNRTQPPGVKLGPVTWWSSSRSVGPSHVGGDVLPTRKIKAPSVAKAFQLDENAMSRLMDAPTTTEPSVPEETDVPVPTEDDISTKETPNLGNVSPTNAARNPNVTRKGYVPVHYVLEVQPNLEPSQNFSFNGTVEITFACRLRTALITLHAAPGLSVEVLYLTATFRSVPKPLRVEKTWRNLIKDEFVIQLKDRLHKNERYNLSLKFSGKMGTEPKGLYRVSYRDRNKDERWAALTNFRPRYSRRVFPCFDDPALKASFDIIIVHKRGINTVSNMPVYRTERRTASLVADTFARTPKIPSYLIAFTLNDFPSFGKGTV
ncbi:unnamed protein product, partial [Ixodes pacificus]